MSASKHRYSVVLGVVAGAALTLTGCSSTDNAGPTGQPSTAITPVVTPVETPAVTGTTVMVTETEFAIDLSQDTFAPGTYTFEVTNDGGISHNLNISGPGIANEMTSTLSAGGSESLTVTLQEGTYELWCSIGSHKAQGMDLTITVG